METISELAARWAVRSDAGLNADEARELEAWLDADPRHRGAYIRARAQWVDLDRLSALNGPALTVEHSARVSISRRSLLAASVAAVSILGAGSAWIALRDPRTRFATTIGEVRRLPLSDGSTILLNTDSEVLVQLTAEQRTIHLRRGEALFEVAHDRNRPFIVHANETSVRAVGTSFTVRLEAEQIDVMVTEGVVELSAASSLDSSGAAPSTVVRPITQRVRKNERAVIANAGAPTVERIAEPQLSRQLAWRDGMVSFDGESLLTAVGEINRHNVRQIVIDDAVLGARPVVGVFRATDVEGFAAAAAATLKARAVIATDAIRLEPIEPAQ